jgi:uncharacterized Zn-binding protein involved in type VI secretion
MSQPAAAQGDLVVAIDTHVVIVPGGPPTPTSLPFSGHLADGLSPNVRIGGRAAAVVGSGAANLPPHIPVEPGAVFQRPPTNRATLQAGSATVRINHRPAARNGDPAVTCGDPVDAAVGTVVATGVVRIG